MLYQAHPNVVLPAGRELRMRSGGRKRTTYNPRRPGQRGTSAQPVTPKPSVAAPKGSTRSGVLRRKQAR